jgi:hypothetical protein
MRVVAYDPKLVLRPRYRENAFAVCEYNASLDAMTIPASAGVGGPGNLQP